jgi:chromosome segregation ATPase
MNMNSEKKNGLDEQIQNTQTHLENLKSERDDFQNRMTAAVGAGDSAAMINLKHRQNELPVEIATAQIRLSKMQLQADEARLPLLQAKVSKFTEPIQSAVLKRDAAVLELNQLQSEYHAVNEDFRDLRIRIGERTRELARLIYLSNPAREISGSRLRSLNSA